MIFFYFLIYLKLQTYMKKIIFPNTFKKNLKKTKARTIARALEKKT